MYFVVGSSVTLAMGLSAMVIKNILYCVVGTPVPLFRVSLYDEHPQR